MSGRLASMLIIIAVTAVVLFFNLGAVPLLDPDEPVYAETAKEMMLYDDFLSPRIYGEYWYDKPPMYYWLTAGAFKIFGVNEFAARFPSALLALLCALYVYAAGARLFGERAGLAGALVLVTSIEYFYLGKAAVTDITLTFFLTVALLAFLERRYYLFYACAGLAVVTKGPIGLLVPAAIMFLYMLFGQKLSLLRQMKIPVGILIFAVTALPWYGLMYNIHGLPFLDTFIGFHNITRFTTPEHPEGMLWYYFIPVLTLGFLPWTALLIQSVWAALTDSKDDYYPLLFLIIWAAFIFVFFSISRTKLVSYILPMFPPLALVMGWYFNRLWDWRRKGRLLSWPLMATLLLGVLAAGMLYGARAMPELVPGAIAAAVVLAVTVAGLWYYVWRRELGRAFCLQIGSMVVIFAILSFLMLPQAAVAFHSRDIARAFTTHYDGKSPVYVIKFLRPGFAFYSGVYGTELSPEEWSKIIATPQRAFFVVRRPDYETLSGVDHQKLQVLATSDEKLLLFKP